MPRQNPISQCLLVKQAGHSWPRANEVDRNGETRPPGIAKYGAKKESELAVLEELCERWERHFGYRVEFSEGIFDALT